MSAALGCWRATVVSWLSATLGCSPTTGCGRCWCVAGFSANLPGVGHRVAGLARSRGLDSHLVGARVGKCPVNVFVGGVWLVDDRAGAQVV